MPTRSFKPYDGKKKGLVLSIDIGTTYSGVSYAFLEPGKRPEIKTVYGWTDFKKQEGNYRIPTVVYYGKDGRPCGFGYMKEDDTDGESEQSDDFVDASEVDVSDEISYPYASRWFKLHLCPGDFELPADIARTLPPLPPGKTVIDVLGDFLKYVYEYTRKYLQEKDVIDGHSIWDQVESEISFVLTHPNRWRGQAQTRMREAAVRGGLVPNMDEALKRVKFMTEGEANLHYCVYHEMIGGADKKPDGNTLLVVDAGGGTVDLSSYTISLDPHPTAMEIAIPSCVLEGSTMVTRRMEMLLSQRFSKSEYGSAENIREMVLKFDAEDKPRFSADLTRGLNIDFRVHSRDDKALGLKKGRPHVSFEEMRKCFQPALDGILKSISEQVESAESTITTVFLMGGFSANDWLFYELEKAVKDKHGLVLHRPASQVCKEVAEGGAVSRLTLEAAEGSAVSSLSLKVKLVKRYKVERTYGTPVSVRLNPLDPEHVRRKDAAYPTPFGLMIGGGFSTIMLKGAPVEVGKEFSEGYMRTVSLAYKDKLDHLTEEILTYDGESTQPCWLDKGSKDFKPICSVRADLSNCQATCEDFGPIKMYRKKFDIVFKYTSEDSDELTAQIRWEENGERKWGPAQVIHDRESPPKST